jgi:peptidoglycan/xylan/chitin deacetylase (PgdA/CDA1 family)
VVATAVGGTPSVVRDGKTGWLVPPEEPDALARALLSAASDPSEVRRRGAAGKTLLAEEYSAQSSLDRLEALLEAAHQGKRPARAASADSPPLKPRPYYYLTRGYQRARLAAASTSNRAWQWTGVRIFGYHRVTEATDVVAVTPEQFRGHLEALASSDVEPVSLDRALDLLDGASEGRFACITFDDGFEDMKKWAVPLLREFGMSATIFLPTSVLDGSVTYSWYRNPPAPLSWEDVTALAREGVVDFGAHTRTHPTLTRLDEAEAREEIAGSRAVLERRLERPVTMFSYPAGLYGEREARLVEEAGFRGAVTTRGGVNDAATPRTELKRTMIIWRDGPEVFRAKLAGSLDGPARATDWLQRRRAGRRR